VAAQGGFLLPASPRARPLVVHWEPESALGGPLYGRIDKKGRSKKGQKTTSLQEPKKKRELVPLV